MDHVVPLIPGCARRRYAWTTGASATPPWIDGIGCPLPAHDRSSRYLSICLRVIGSAVPVLALEHPQVLERWNGRRQGGDLFSGQLVDHSRNVSAPARRSSWT